MIDIAEHRLLRGQESDFKQFPRAALGFDSLEIDRSSAPTRMVDLSGRE